MNSTPFASAMRIFTTLRDAKSWAGIYRRESDTANPTDDSAWRRVDAANAFDGPFDAIRVVTAGHLDPVEIVCVLGCLGYALQAMLAGDEVGMPVVSYVVKHGRVTATILEMFYDSESTIRTEPDPAEAFQLARQYVAEGTPSRKTSRSGPMGTRLVEGIGARDIGYYVR